jgi:hypothetical protein
MCVLMDFHELLFLLQMHRDRYLYLLYVYCCYFILEICSSDRVRSHCLTKGGLRQATSFSSPCRLCVTFSSLFHSFTLCLYIVPGIVFYKGKLY